MTLTTARELIAVHAGLGGGYHKNSAQPILAEAEREPSQAAADPLIRELGLQRIFGFQPGSSLQ